MTSIIGDGEESGWISMTSLTAAQRKLVEDIHQQSTSRRFTPHPDAQKEAEPWFPPCYDPNDPNGKTKKSVSEQYAESLMSGEFTMYSCVSAGKTEVKCCTHETDPLLKQLCKDYHTHHPTLPANEPGNNIPYAPPVSTLEAPAVTPEVTKRLLEESAEWGKKMAPKIKAIEGIASDDRPAPSPTASSPKTLDSSHKIPVNLCPASAIIAIALVIAQGHKKPGRTIYNWRDKKQKISYMNYHAAALRHLLKSIDGSDFDQELSELAGVPVRHDWAAMSCLAILEDARQAGTLVDDRPVKGGAEEFLDKLTVKKNV